MKSIDCLLDRHYDPQHYHCVHFLLEAAQYLFNQDYSSSFIGLTGSLHETLKTSRHTVVKNRRIDHPIDGSIVLMTNQNQSSHVGLFYCGRVLHLTELGVHYLNIQVLKKFYKRIRYYEPITHIHQSS
ncbi:MULTISPECIES: hypothetical protein [Acinetobacter calcoaceticus/baumannii complex]|uniref:NlpC/P60 domain-containing protein n=2 Tax=Acinetobacter calcoaceticus/baumannii complex TaxID=909768 RepID=A0AAE9M6L3_ACIPI|nr:MULTISPECIES: hypothetical protein [Acinetobacter calcoaceticus/baumannii complex]AZP30389.1 hypothetical protein DLK06_15630 [Acinetobacter pittii]EHT1074423.1 hypothetical protein [Acinetobacter baumannii]EKV7758492.1 hypothetical protein [Acinetobacter baumannii]EKW7507248.1 hypothetical protein [Acinetobacter baumannii]EKW8719257.1 hypothetical protein [Acinetobacter baumannii]